MCRPRLRKLIKAVLIFAAVAIASIIGFALYCHAAMIRMPGASFSGQLPPLTQSQQQLAAELRETVAHLASDVGKRSIYHPKELAEAALYLKQQLESLGYTVIDHSFPSKGSLTPNLEATLKGASHPEEIIVVGAHYDTTQRSPGADDNASGCAAALSLAK